MSRTDSGMPQNADFFAPPPLGPELAGGKWKVHVIDDDGKITEENIPGKQVSGKREWRRTKSRRNVYCITHKIRWR
ncbi:unnamed protein product [Microthlaspi erraticum]|uniref:Uncharacterized protein n=1 Tax=Microthlaspi erraticum TaxID=1685480 RepID=A0A6D2JKY2_9BRAS|nr:unnamed protein product [Microthlaspi erraticum]